MNSLRIAFFCLNILILASLAFAETITSTPEGGPWHYNTTWVGHVVPTLDDDVVIAGPVSISSLPNYCNNVTIISSGLLKAGITQTRTLVVYGDLDNAGTITDGVYFFEIQVAGNLHNSGVWENHDTTIIGASDRQISHDPGFGFSTHLQFDPDASGDLIATTALELIGSATMTGGRLVLLPDCPFTLEAGAFRGDLLGNGNEMRFVSWSYLIQCSIDDVVLVGEAEASFEVRATTRVTVMDRLQNGGNSGGGGMVVEGDLINYGLIRNDNYSFWFNVYGDIENYGTISLPILSLSGVDVTHHLKMGPGGVFDSPISMPEFQNSTLVAETPISIAGTLNLGIGTLILEPGNSLDLSTSGGIGSGVFGPGTLMANGNSISSQGSGGLSGLIVDQAVIDGQISLGGEVQFTNGLIVHGTLTGAQWASADVSVEGILVNQGLIADGNQPLRITILGDVQNSGSFTNDSITLAGSTDQVFGAGTGLAMGQFVMESGLQGAGYQWFKNGEAIFGEDGVNLTLESVGPDQFGVYHCMADGASSRFITIAEAMETSGVPDLAGLVELEQNHPNPFNPITEIAFSLKHDNEVSLVVYDLAGREVQRLVEGPLDAGRHSITWQPRDVASGTYFYGLKVDGHTLVKKCVLLK